MISIAGLLSLARFSQAFLVLKASDVGVDAAFVPMGLVIMHLVFLLAAYQFDILADHLDRRLQLRIGTIILICGFWVWLPQSFRFSPFIRRPRCVTLAR